MKFNQTGAMSVWLIIYNKINLNTFSEEFDTLLYRRMSGE